MVWVVAGIEGCRGFVEEQDFRFERQRTGKAEALLLPPRKYRSRFAQA